jgi:hypothetical protein
MWILVPLLLVTAGLAPAQKNSDKVPPSGKGSDSKVAIEATAYYDREQIKKLIGMDPGESIVVVAVKVAPAQGETVNLSLDDFLLRSDRDGQKSRPLEPAQVAGGTVMVIKSVGGSQGTGMSEQRRVPYGVPGTPGGGGSLPIPGQSPNVGSATADTSEARASIEEKPQKANPLLDVLKQKVLAEGEVDKPVEGLLYFLMEGKLRTKDLELVYRKAPPRVSLRFYEPGQKHK